MIEIYFINEFAIKDDRGSDFTFIELSAGNCKCGCEKTSISLMVLGFGITIRFKI